MARRKHKPFGDSLEVEREKPRELFSKDVPSRIGSLNELARDGVERGIDGLPARTRALVYAGVGGLGSAALWGVKLAEPAALSELSEIEFFPYVVVGLSCLATFGLLQLVFGPVSISQPGANDAPFGGFVAARGEETLWKRRMISIAIGLLHSGVYLWA